MSDPHREEPMLNHQVAIFIPTKKGNGDSIPTELWEQWIIPVKTTFADLFGGYTSFQAVGGYMSEKYDKLIEEHIVVVCSFCTETQLCMGRTKVRKLAENLRFSLVQECVAVVFDGQMEFIES